MKINNLFYKFHWIQSSRVGAKLPKESNILYIGCQGHVFVEHSFTFNNAILFILLVEFIFLSYSTGRENLSAFLAYYRQICCTGHISSRREPIKATHTGCRVGKWLCEMFIHGCHLLKNAAVALFKTRICNLMQASGSWEMETYKGKLNKISKEDIST